MLQKDSDLMLLLGRLDAQITNLSKEMKKSFKVQEETKIKIDLLTQKILQAEQKTRSLHERLNDVEEPVKKIRIWQERSVGVFIAVCLSSAFLGEAAKNYIIKFISLFS